MKKMNADDVMAIEQVANFYEQAYGTGGHIHHLPAIFSVKEDTSVNASARAVGPDGVKAQYQEYYDGTPLYDTYHCTHSIGMPIIEVDGDTARGQFLTSATFINCCAGIPAREIPDPPYTISALFDTWYHDFVKENNLWKIHHMHFCSLGGFGFCDPFWSWNPNDGGLASQCRLYTLSTPFPIMDYVADRGRWEVNRREVQ